MTKLTWWPPVALLGFRTAYFIASQPFSFTKLRWSRQKLCFILWCKYTSCMYTLETVKFTLTDIICDRFCFYKVLKVHRTTPQKLSSPRLRLQVLRVKGYRRATVLYSGKSTTLCYSRADPPLALISSKRNT